MKFGNQIAICKPFEKVKVIGLERTILSRVTVQLA